MNTVGYKFLPALVAVSLAMGSVQAADTLSITPKIIGGEEAARGNWPWMAGLIFMGTNTPYDGQFCGGTLIEPDWVVTAAHCTDGSTVADFYVVVGLHDLLNDIGNGIGQRIKIKRIINHPGYDSATMANDIALLQLAKPAASQPATLYTTDNSLAGQYATAIGWGNTDSTGLNNYPATLQQVTLPIISNTTCTAAYGAGSIYSSMLCAGYVDGGKDSCQGDSGGPLVVAGASGWELAGLTSWGYGCAQPGKPGVYTRVSSFGGYIQETVTKDYVACADANGDSLVDAADATAYRAQLVTELNDWVQSCWQTRQSCGDIDGDSVVTRQDKTKKVYQLRAALDEWRTVCWIPEVR